MNSVISNIKMNIDMLNSQVNSKKYDITVNYEKINNLEQDIDEAKKELIELHSALKVLENSEELLGNVDIPQKSAPKL